MKTRPIRVNLGEAQTRLDFTTLVRIHGNAYVHEGDALCVVDNFGECRWSIILNPRGVLRARDFKPSRVFRTRPV